MLEISDLRFFRIVIATMPATARTAQDRRWRSLFVLFCRRIDRCAVSQIFKWAPSTASFLFFRTVPERWPISSQQTLLFTQYAIQPAVCPLGARKRDTYSVDLFAFLQTLGLFRAGYAPGPA